ncbi:histidine kinase (plasmid) [Nostoc sp. NIES-2111]|nr:histidine kinase [Nostoc sp. NIES-2111]
MQQEFISKQLDLSALLHDVSNNHQGASILLNQIIAGAYGQSLEEIRPFLIGLQELNERVVSLIQSRKTTFFEPNPITVTQFDMLAFLQKTYCLFNPIAQYHSLKLHYETQTSYKHGTQIRADGVSIDRMICNILTNAIKYTSRGEIFLRLLHQRDDLIIEIEDTGIGIAAEQISNIFIPLWRSPTVGGTPSPAVERSFEPNSSHRVGKGLGLYIALSVAQAHGLDIKVNSTVGQGSKFTIIFPYKDDGIYGLDGRMLPKSQKVQDALPI